MSGFCFFCSMNASSICAAAMASSLFFFLFLVNSAGAIFSSAANVLNRSSWKFMGISIFYFSCSAHSRDNFAKGALLAAEWPVGKKAGMYTMADCLGLG